MQGAPLATAQALLTVRTPGLGSGKTWPGQDGTTQAAGEHLSSLTPRLPLPGPDDAPGSEAGGRVERKRQAFTTYSEPTNTGRGRTSGYRVSINIALAPASQSGAPADGLPSPAGPGTECRGLRVTLTARGQRPAGRAHSLMSLPSAHTGRAGGRADRGPAGRVGRLHLTAQASVGNPK